MGFADFIMNKVFSTNSKSNVGDTTDIVNNYNLDRYKDEKQIAKRYYKEQLDYLNRFDCYLMDTNYKQLTTFDQKYKFVRNRGYQNKISDYLNNELCAIIRGEKTIKDSLEMQYIGSFLCQSEASYVNIANLGVPEYDYDTRYTRGITGNLIHLLYSPEYNLVKCVGTDALNALLLNRKDVLNITSYNYTKNESNLGLFLDIANTKENSNCRLMESNNRYTCVYKLRDKKGEISSYILAKSNELYNDASNANRIEVNANELKSKIREGAVVVTNLTLTSDNRLVSKMSTSYNKKDNYYNDTLIKRSLLIKKEVEDIIFKRFITGITKMIIFTGHEITADDNFSGLVNPNFKVRKLENKMYAFDYKLGTNILLNIPFDKWKKALNKSIKHGEGNLLFKYKVRVEVQLEVQGIFDGESPYSKSDTLEREENFINSITKYIINVDLKYDDILRGVKNLRLCSNIPPVEIVNTKSNGLVTDEDKLEKLLIKKINRYNPSYNTFNVNNIYDRNKEDERQYELKDPYGIMCDTYEEIEGLLKNINKCVDMLEIIVDENRKKLK